MTAPGARARSDGGNGHPCGCAAWSHDPAARAAPAVASEAALQAADDFERTEKFDAFIESVDYGVSSDLIDSLTKLAHRRREVRIGVRWSPLIAQHARTPSEVIVTPRHVPALRTAAKRFKAPAAVTTVTITGTVAGLDRAKFGEAGISRIEISSGTSARRLRARLSNEQYFAAIEAHRRGFAMRMTGELRYATRGSSCAASVSAVDHLIPRSALT